MSELWRAQGGAAHRIGLPARDLSKPRARLQAGDLLFDASLENGEGRANVIWGSLHCSPWSAIQNFMKRKAQLAVERAQSRHMI